MHRAVTFSFGNWQLLFISRTVGYTIELIKIWASRNFPLTKEKYKHMFVKYCKANKENDKPAKRKIKFLFDQNEKYILTITVCAIKNNDYSCTIIVNFKN